MVCAVAILTTHARAISKLFAVRLEDVIAARQLFGSLCNGSSSGLIIFQLQFEVEGA